MESELIKTSNSNNRKAGKFSGDQLKKIEHKNNKKYGLRNVWR